MNVLKIFVGIIVIIAFLIYIYYYFNFGKNKKYRLNGNFVENLCFDEALVVDVRTRAEYERGHSKNAINLPFGVIKNDSRILENYKNKQIIFYCTLDVMSTKAKKYFFEKGYENLQIADGYMQYSYKKRMYPNILLNDFKGRALERDTITLNVSENKYLKKEVHIVFETLENNFLKLNYFKDYNILIFSDDSKKSMSASDFLYERGFKVVNLIEDFKLENFQTPFDKAEQEKLYSKKIEQEFCSK